MPTRKFTLVGSLILSALFASVAFGAESDAAAEGVTFENRSRDTQHVLVMYGAAQCSEMTQKVQLSLEPNAKEVAKTGDSSVCWCSSTLGKVGSCSEWNKAKAGKKVVVR
jgi:hypothetical protein